MRLSSLIALLQDFPTDEHVRKVCRLGQRKKTCRYLTAGSSGWGCEKASSLRRTIDERFAAGKMNARGDNCDGLLGLILRRKEELIGKKVTYTETMPSVSASGKLRDIKVAGKMLAISANWEGDLNCDNSISIAYLDISVSPGSLTFELGGVGSFAGTTTILV